MAGHSLIPYLTGKEDVKKDTLFFEWGGNRAVRADHWKILSLKSSKDWKLFNISIDRGETKNVASVYPEIVNKLSQSYTQWAKSHQVSNTDSLLIASPNGKSMIRFQESIIKTLDE